MPITKPSRRYEAALENAIAERLRDRRVAIGQSQRLVAERLNISGATLSHWESGRSFPNSFVAYQSWARALGGTFKINLKLPGDDNEWR